MINPHDKSPRPRRVSESAPVQVFLNRSDQSRLDRLTDQLEITKSEVLRRSLAALERQLLDPLDHPALRIIGLVEDDDGVGVAGDAAVNHDQFLADAHDPSTLSTGRRRRGKA